MIVPFINAQIFHIFGDHTKVFRKKGMMESIGIQKDTGTDRQILAMDTRPNYTAPLPHPPAMWKYRAIYSNDAHRIGQWSNVAEISVGA
jgi:hypothetical protein